MKFLIVEKCGFWGQELTIATAKSLPAIMSKLKAEFLAYHPYDGRSGIDGWCDYEDWHYGENQVSEVRVYPMGRSAKVPLFALISEWEKTTDVRYAKAKEDAERAEYARLHKKYGKDTK